MNKVEVKFLNKASVNRGTYLIFSKKDAIDFVKECAFEKIGILGIDCFYKIDERTIQPSMENSIDFSSKNKDIVNVHDKAIEFIKSRDEKVYFEIVCE